MNLKNPKTIVISVSAVSLMAFGIHKFNHKDKSNLMGLFSSQIEHTKRKNNRFTSLGAVKDLRIGNNSEMETISYLRNLSEWDEQDYKHIEKTIISPLISALKARNMSSLDKLTTNAPGLELSGLPLTGKSLVQSSTLDGIAEFDWSAQKKFSGITNFKNAFNTYASAFSQIQYVDMIATEVISPVEERGTHAEMLRAKIHIRYDLRGIGTDKLRRQDRSDVVVFVKRVKGNEWSLEKMEFLNGESLFKETPSFVNANHTVGLSNIQTYLRKEAIRRGGYALSMTDVDRDGVVDMLVGSMGHTQLLKGQKNGSFVKTASALDKETLVKSAVFADFRNQGVQDLLVVRFEPSKFIKGLSNDEVILYENDGKGNFTRNTTAFNKSIDTSKYDHAMPAAVADFNNDGLLDIYVGFPGKKDFTFMGARNVAANYGKRVQGLYLNQGDGSYMDAISKKSKNDFQMFNEVSGTQVFPHSALAADFDRNGHMDVLVIDDMGNLSPMYKNTGDGNFNQSAQRIGLSNHQIGMSAAIGDFNNDGIFDVMMTNVTFDAARRLNASSKTNYFEMPYSTTGTSGLRLFQGQKNQNEITYTEKNAGLEFSGEGLAGVEFIDYNNDGWSDIYVVNGLWSGTTDDKSQDLSSLYSRAGTAANRFLKMFASEDKDSQKTSSFLMRILQSFKGDVGTPDKIDQNGNRPSLAGFQHNKLFRNNRNGTFTEVGFLEGVDSVADGYIVALSDLNKDGKMDLVLRNADPGSVDNSFSPVEVFVNQNNNGLKSVILSLEGNSGNKDGIGVIAEADVNGKTMTRQLVANNGTAQSERILHFGLGNRNSIDELRLQWPSGKMQVVKNLPAGRHHITEPKLILKSAKL